MSDASVFKSSFNRPNLYYEIRPKHDVDREIIRYIKQHEGKSGIIYCLSRKKVEELSELLAANNIKVLPITPVWTRRRAPRIRTSFCTSRWM